MKKLVGLAIIGLALWEAPDATAAPDTSIKKGDHRPRPFGQWLRVQGKIVNYALHGYKWQDLHPIRDLLRNNAAAGPRQHRSLQNRFAAAFRGRAAQWAIELLPAREGYDTLHIKPKDSKFYGNGLKRAWESRVPVSRDELRTMIGHTQEWVLGGLDAQERALLQRHPKSAGAYGFVNGVLRSARGALDEGHW